SPAHAGEGPGYPSPASGRGWRGAPGEGYAGGGTRSRVPLKVMLRPDFRRAALRCDKKSSFASASVDGTYVAPAASVFCRSRAKAEPPATIIRSGNDDEIN